MQGELLNRLAASGLSLSLSNRGEGVPGVGDDAQHRVFHSRLGRHPGRRCTRNTVPRRQRDEPKGSVLIMGMSNHAVTVSGSELIAGTADKFYRSFIIETESGATVTFQYGRNGTVGSFTPRKDFPTFAAAVKVAEKKLAEKIGKGYNPTIGGAISFDSAPTDSDLDRAANVIPVGGTAISMPTLREQSAVVVSANAAAPIDTEAFDRVCSKLETGRGITGPAAITRPMLASIVDPSDLQYLLSQRGWVMQPKIDGDRVVIEVIDGVVSVLNRSGQPKVKNVGEAHLSPFRALTQGRWVFDGEVVGRKIWFFDMPAAGDFHDEGDDFITRYRNLTLTLINLNVDPESIGLVHTTEGTDAKRALLADADAAGKEGVMFRRADAAYEPGRRSESLVKHKFIKEVDAFVTRVNIGGKDNAELAVHAADGSVQVIGQVTTIGKGEIKVGDVLEILYLYIVSPEAPRLYQPRVMRVRTDEKSAAECSIDQLAHAVTDKSVS